jgi:hypothetical protein
MAKSRKVRRAIPLAINKSQAIREKLSDLGEEARPRDIIAALKSEGVVVSPALVTNVVTRIRRAADQTGDGRVHARSASVSLEALIEAKRFVRCTGSLKAARAALEALARLM